MLVNYTESGEEGQPGDLFFFVDVDEEAEEETESEDLDAPLLLGRENTAKRFFFRLPNPLRTKLALANCLWLFRELSKVFVIVFTVFSIFLLFHAPPPLLPSMNIKN